MKENELNKERERVYRNDQRKQSEDEKREKTKEKIVYEKDTHSRERTKEINQDRFPNFTDKKAKQRT